VAVGTWAVEQVIGTWAVREAVGKLAAEVGHFRTTATVTAVAVATTALEAAELHRTMFVAATTHTEATAFVEPAKIIVGQTIEQTDTQAVGEKCSEAMRSAVRGMQVRHNQVAAFTIAPCSTCLRP
jgi:hypothetical protein